MSAKSTETEDGSFLFASDQQDTASRTGREKDVQRGYCPNGCGTLRWKRKRFNLGTKVLYPVCPTCFPGQLKSISADEATSQIDTLIKTFDGLTHEISGKCRDLSRLTKELEMLKEDIEEEGSTRNVNTQDYEDRLEKTTQVVEKKVEEMVEQSRTKPPTPLEQIKELRADMVQLEEQLRQQQKEGNTRETMPGYALVDVLAQLEQVKAEAREDKTLWTQRNQAFDEEINELQADLRIVQRTLTNVPGELSELSKNVGTLSDKYSTLVADIQKKHEEYDKKFEKQKELNAELTRRIEELEARIDNFTSQSVPPSGGEVDEIRRLLEEFTTSTVTAEALPVDGIFKKDIEALVTRVESLQVYAPSGDIMDSEATQAEATVVGQSQDVARPPSVTQGEASAAPLTVAHSSSLERKSSLPCDDSVPSTAEVVPIATPIQPERPEDRKCSPETIAHATAVPTTPPPTKRDDSYETTCVSPLIRLSGTNRVSDILRIMQEEHHQSDVQALGCLKLARLMERDVREEIGKNTTMAVEMGGIFIVLQALTGHPEAMEVQINACFALYMFSCGSSENKPTIVNSGAIDFISESLRKFANVADMQEYGLMVLLNFATGEHSAMVINAGGVSLALTALCLHPQSDAIEHVGLFLLGNLTDQGDMALIAKEVGIDLVLSSMDQFPKKPIIQSWGCRAINELSQEEKRGVRQVLEALKNHPSDVDVQTNGLEALSCLLDGNAENITMAFESGASQLALAALQGTDGPASIQKYALKVLGSMAAAGPDYKRGFIVEYGGVYLVLESMNRHRDDASIAGAGTYLLCQISSVVDNGTWATIGSSGATDLILDALRNHPNDPYVQRWAICLLCRLIDGHAGTMALAINAGAVEVILSALQGVHRAVADVQEFGLLAIGNMAASGYAENRTIINNAGGVYCVLESLRAHPDAAMVQQWGLYALGNLAVGKIENSQMIIAAGGNDFVVAALRKYPDVAAIQQYGLLALGNLAEAGNTDQVFTDVVTDALRSHPDVAAVQHWGFYALNKFAEAGNAITWFEFADMHGLEITLKAITTYSNDVAVQAGALHALYSLGGAKSDQNTVAIKKWGAVRSVLDALKTHADDAAVQQNGLLALGVLEQAVEGQDVVVESICLALDALRAFPRAADINQYAFYVISQFGTPGDAEMRTMIANNGGIDLVLAGMRGFPDNSDIQMSGCRIIKMLATKSAKNRRELQSKGAVEVVKNASELHPEDAAGALAELKRRSTFDWRK